ncbi:MAG: hypothetical protein U1E46_06905 [Hyphomicrobiales bacterium]
MVWSFIERRRAVAATVFACAVASFTGATLAETKDNYWNNLSQYQYTPTQQYNSTQYGATQQVQKQTRQVQKQVATAPVAAPLKGNTGKTQGYFWVGGKSDRAFDDPDLAKTDNLTGDPDDTGWGDGPQRPGGGVLNLWMKF